MTARRLRVSAVASVVLVAAVAALVSYCHMQDLSLRAGEGWRSHIIPLSVDGMLVAATLAIVDRRRHRQPAGWVPWLGLGLGIAASLAANVAAAQPGWIARIIAAWPPVALAVSVETLVVVLRHVDTAAPVDVTDRAEECNAVPAAQPAAPDARQESATPPVSKPARTRTPRTGPAKTPAERKQAQRARARNATPATNGVPVEIGA